MLCNIWDTPIFISYKMNFTSTLKIVYNLITYASMKTYLHFRNLTLALSCCVVFNSCAKDTDLLSEYVITGAGRIENLTSSNAISDEEIGAELISINDFPVWENHKDAEVLEFTN